MKILQLSDYHFSKNDTSKNLGEEIISRLESKLTDYDDIDFIFFTGDLVFSGKEKAFQEAYNSLIHRLGKLSNVPKKNIFISAGNHDVNWSNIQKSIEVYFETQITNDKSLDDLVNHNINDYQNSLKPLQDFNSFLEEKEYAEADQVSKLYSTHLRQVNGKKIGIATINTAWRSGKNSDYGKLLFPASFMDKIINNLKSTDCKLLLFHHPFSWFQGYNQETIRDKVFKFFDIGFCGHEHQNQVSSHFMKNQGILINQSPASLTFEKGRAVGAAIIDYDFNDEHKIQITPILYDKDQNAFLKSEKISSTIPHGEKKEKQNRIRRKIKSKLNLEISKANDLVLYDDNKDGESSFIRLFSKPSLKETPKAQMSQENLNNQFNFENFHELENNYLILGRDKSGKTSILKKLQIDFLEFFPNKPFVPFYIDYKELEAKSGSNLDLITHIRNYFELNTTDTKRIIEKYQLVLLLDNFVNDHFITNEISSLVDQFEGIKLIICGEETTYNTVDGFGIDQIDFKKLFIHDLKRKQIRKFSNRWNISNEQEHVLERIVKVCQQLELPLNYWTTSLFLLIHKKTRVDASKNLFEILDLCIEEILDKKRLLLSQQNLNFDIIKNLCSKLSYELLTEYRNENYSTSYKEILEFFEKEIDKSPRISAEAKEVLDYLLDTGILKEKQDNLITFRLNGFLEYFLAKYLTKENEFKDKVLNDNQLYLSFKNELELYSGFRRDDEDFLRKIFDKTKNDLEFIHKTYSELSNPDEILQNKISVIQDLKETARKLQGIEPISHEDQDVLRDEIETLEIQSDVHKKKIYNYEEMTPEIVEKYLKILSRVLKNSIEVENYDLMYEIFDYLLESYMYFGFYLIDELQNNEFGELDKFDISDRQVHILKIISSFVPIITQVQFFEGIGNHSVIQIIERKIENLKKNHEKNQYALFLLYFLLFDIDLENQKNKIDEVLELINMGILKTSILLKLNYYLAFKAYNKPKLENFINNKIRKANRLLGKSDHSRSLNKQLDEKSKTNLIKRKTEQ